VAKKNRATFAKREKERARLSKQAEKRQKRQQTPDPNAAQIPGPMPMMSVFADDDDPAAVNDDVVTVDEYGVVVVEEVAHAGDAPREP
jgi:hypothetical protein